MWLYNLYLWIRRFETMKKVKEFLAKVYAEHGGKGIAILAIGAIVFIAVTS